MRLSEYLKQNNLTQDDFAALIKVTRPTVSRYVTGARFPGRDDMQRIVDATGGAVTANDFLPDPPARDAGDEPLALRRAG